MKTLNDPGPKPELKWIPLDKLYVDHDYQRNMISSSVCHLASAAKVSAR
jgi:hypothetical protein